MKRWRCSGCGHDGYEEEFRQDGWHHHQLFSHPIKLGDYGAVVLVECPECSTLLVLLKEEARKMRRRSKDAG